MEGKRIIIKAQGLTFRGKILTYTDFGYNGTFNRHIEFINDATGKYHYIKEPDGITSVEIID